MLGSMISKRDLGFVAADSNASGEVRSGDGRPGEMRRGAVQPSVRGAVGAAICAALLLASGCGDGSIGSTGSGGGGTGGAGAGNAGSGGNGGNGGAGGDLGLTSGSGGGGGAGGAAPCGSTLEGIVRDFHTSHPDFEAFLGDDKGIVQNNLGMDGKPVYAGNPTTQTTTGKDNFDQWYRDVAGINVAIPLSIELVDLGGGAYAYDNAAFFPIDGQGFMNEGNPHNYHFTLEIKTQFEYKGGEVFSFTGDDDLFTFINGKLAINLGGVHGAESETVDLDAKAAELGISVGNTYSLDFFFAERHTSESNFHIETTISCFSSPPRPE